MRLGLADDHGLSEEALAGVREPFATEESREALADAGIGLQLEGFVDDRRACCPRCACRCASCTASRTASFPTSPTRWRGCSSDVPHAVVTALPDCGHFLQEEAPREIGELLAEFFAAPRQSAG